MEQKKNEWFKAARTGDHKLLTKLLAEQPALITAVDPEKTALRVAASNGHEQVVALLLAADPTLVDAKGRDGWTALHFAASEGHDKVVAQLLAAGPHVIHALGSLGRSPLHLASSGGHGKVVALLLAESPAALIMQADAWGETALHLALDNGSEEVCDQLLANCPELIDSHEGVNNNNLLNWAVHRGRSKFVTQISPLRPDFITAVNQSGYNAVHSAIWASHQSMAEEMLAIKPEAVFGVSKLGRTTLHDAIDFCGDDIQFVAKLWQMNPRALHAEDYDSLIPFDLVVSANNEELTELFQWSLSLDELACAFAKNQPQNNNDHYQKRYRPIVEAQCESLWVSLNRDVAPLVFEYLGFGRRTKQTTNRTSKRKKKIAKN